MKKISSDGTAFKKKALPVLWFGLLAVHAGLMVALGVGKTHPMLLLLPLGMAVFGFFLMRHLIFDLVDEVYDGGDFLLIKNRDEEDRVLLSDILNVSASTNQNPPRITLRLARACRFGAEVAFSPVKNFSFNPFAKNEVAEDLVARVDRAKARRGV